VRRLPKVRTAATVSVAQLDPSTVQVTGRVTRGRGKAFVVFQKRVGGGWKTARRIRRRAGRAIAVTQTLKPGRWRVFVSYPGGKRFKKARSRRVSFVIA
jgi:ketosteroid isomerase-like protein